MRLTGIFLLLAFTVTLFAVDWSDNHTIKFTSYELNQMGATLDKKNIAFYDYYIEAAVSSYNAETSVTNEGLGNDLSSHRSWLRTANISVGEDYLLKSMFINMKGEDPDNGVLLRLRDNRDDEILAEKEFFETGSFELVNIFDKEVYLSIEFMGISNRVFSFGVRREEETIIDESKVFLNIELLYDNMAPTPGILNVGTDKLKLSFNMHVPSYLDIIVFDSEGTIVDYIARNEYFPEGDHQLEWNPVTLNEVDELISGEYLLYLKAESVDNKTSQIVREFQFVNQ